MDLDDKRKALLGLLKQCPAEGDNPENCPLHRIRKDEPHMQVAWASTQTESELDRIIGYHGNCYSRKLHDKIEERIMEYRGRINEKRTA